MNDKPLVLTERRGPVFIVSINRIEARNAVNGETASALLAAFKGARLRSRTDGGPIVNPIQSKIWYDLGSENSGRMPATALSREEILISSEAHRA